MMPGAALLLTRQQVPEVYREAFLVSGYRKPSSSARECLRSCAHLNNECVNVWSHVFGSGYFLILFILLVLEVSATNQSWAPYLPLLVLNWSAILVLTSSSAAHCFSSVYPRGRHMWFFIDYAAIEIYGIASASAHIFYSIPLSPDGLTSVFEQQERFVLLALAFHAVIFVLQCLTRHRWGRARYVVRTLTYVLAFVFNKTPFLARYWSCVAGTSCAVLASSSLSLHWAQIAANTVAGLVNASKIPERFLPGRCDIVGNSHQIMHVLVIVSLDMELRALRADLHSRMDAILADDSLSSTTAFVVVPILAMVSFAFGVYAMTSRLSADGELKGKKKMA